MKLKNEGGMAGPKSTQTRFVGIKIKSIKISVHFHGANLCPWEYYTGHPRHGHGRGRVSSDAIIKLSMYSAGITTTTIDHYPKFRLHRSTTGIPHLIQFQFQEHVAGVISRHMLWLIIMLPNVILAASALKCRKA